LIALSRIGRKAADKPLPSGAGGKPRKAFQLERRAKRDQLAAVALVVRDPAEERRGLALRHVGADADFARDR
jgi:hypothetical protein